MVCYNTLKIFLTRTKVRLIRFVIEMLVDFINSVKKFLRKTKFSRITRSTIVTNPAANIYLFKVDNRNTY